MSTTTPASDIHTARQPALPTHARPPQARPALRPTLLRPGRLHALLLLAAALLLSSFAAGPGTLGWDLQVTHTVQTLQYHLVHDIAAFGNAFGSTLGIVGVAALLVVGALWQRRGADAALLLAALALTRVNVLLKLAFASPRPTAEQVVVRERFEFYGFPSGHTSASVLLVGAALVVLLPHLSARWQRSTAWLTAIALVGSVGFARIYSGAHWPSDVAGGVLWGVLGVWVLVAARSAGVRWWLSLRPSLPQAK